MVVHLPLPVPAILLALNFFWNMLRPALPQVEVKRLAVAGSQTQDPSGFTFLNLCLITSTFFDSSVRQDALSI